MVFKNSRVENECPIFGARKLNFLLRGGWVFGSNSIEDLRYAQSEVTPDIEMDFLVTADGRLVAAHDSSDLLPPGEIVQATSSSKIRNNRRGAPPAFFEEVLAAMELDTMLLADLTPTVWGRTDVLTIAANCVADAGLERRVILVASDLPELMVEQVMAKNILVVLKASGDLTDSAVRNLIKRAGTMGAAGVQLETQNLNAATVHACRVQGLALLGMTWQPLPAGGRAVQLAKRAGVRHFATPYPATVAAAA